MSANEEQLKVENKALKEQVKKLYHTGLKSEIRDALIAEGSSSDVLVPVGYIYSYADRKAELTFAKPIVYVIL